MSVPVLSMELLIRIFSTTALKVILLNKLWKQLDLYFLPTRFVFVINRFCGGNFRKYPLCLNVWPNNQLASCRWCDQLVMWGWQEHNYFSWLFFIEYVLVRPIDKMKDAVIAKLANQAADFYGDAFKQCQYKDNLPKVCEGHTYSYTLTPKQTHLQSAMCRVWWRCKHSSVCLECVLSVWLCVLFCACAFL